MAELKEFGGFCLILDPILTAFLNLDALHTVQVCHRAEICTDTPAPPTTRELHGAQPAPEEHLDLDKVGNHNQDETRN